MTEITPKNKKIDMKKLASFGFTKTSEGYTYSLPLLGGQMKMTALVSPDGRIFAEVTDTAGGDEYVLHLVPGAAGSFVGQVKIEYEAALEKIFSACFEPDVFKSEYSKKIIAYVREKYGDELEFLWTKFPNNAIWRRKDTKKWYAALLTVSGKKIGLDSEELLEILDLRTPPEGIGELIDNKKYFPGYHMNKANWITICLDGSVPFEEMCARLDISYDITIK